MRFHSYGAVLSGWVCQQDGLGTMCKWRQRHQTWLETKASADARQTLTTQSISVPACVTSPRERDLIMLLTTQLGTNFAADISQNIHMCQGRCDGHIGTIATTSRLYLNKAGRIVTALEKFAIMGFDSKCMPHLASFKESHLNKFIGNSMHVACVGSVMILGLMVVGHWQ